MELRRPLCLELCHLDSNNGAFVTLIAQSSTSTVLGLLQIVGGEQAVNYGDVVSGIETGDTLLDMPKAMYIWLGVF